jgi:hypothetical protein
MLVDDSIPSNIMGSMAAVSGSELEVSSHTSTPPCHEDTAQDLEAADEVVMEDITPSAVAPIDVAGSTAPTASQSDTYESTQTDTTISPLLVRLSRLSS